MESSSVPLTILSLLQTSNIIQNFDTSFEISTLNDLIVHSYEKQRIDTIAFFTYEASIEHFILDVMPEIPRVIVTQAWEDLSFHTASDFNSNIFFVAVGGIQTNHKWQFLYDAFTSLQSYVKGVFVVSTPKGLIEHFEWCWQKGFVKVLALVASEKLFSYIPFPTFEVFELPLPEVSEISYFTNRLSDLRGYNVRTAVQFDPPRVFPLHINCWNDSDTNIVGYAGRIYREFLRYHNGVLRIVNGINSSAYNILTIIEQLNRGDIDLSMNPYLPYPGVKISYPLTMMRWCILVPARGELPSYAYFLRPFELTTWFACFAMLCYLGFIDGLEEFIEIKMSKKCLRKSPDFGFALMKMLRLMLSLPVAVVGRKFHWHKAWNYIFVGVFGFVLSNIYLALITSYLANVMLEPQIDTINEMMTLNISIDVAEHEIPIILRSSDLPKGFADFLKPKKPSDMIKNILSLRTDYAYLAREDMINFALEQQKYHLYPRLHIVQECISTVPVGFLMPTHSQFQPILDRFIYRAAGAGLLDRWGQITIVEGFRSGILNIFQENVSPIEALTLEHFQFPYLILFGGTFLAFISFIFEQFKRFGVRIWLKRKY